MVSEIEAFFGRDVSAFTRRLAKLDAEVDPLAKAQLDHRVDELSDAIGRSKQACRTIEAFIGDDGPLLKVVQTRFRESIAGWFDRSWFMQRAKTKPRGYPGDYELLTAIYDRKPKARGLGGYLDLYFLNTTLARAVRARLLAAKMFLVQELGRRRSDVSILNVACGPCRELADGLLYRPDRRVHLTCVDSDRQALEYVQGNITSVGVDLPDTNCECYNALRMSAARSNIRKFGRCDIIYSVGLFDYVPDKYLVPMLQGLRDSLNQDGVLYVAFKDAERYDKTEYQWHVDWHFFQRTEGDCRELMRQAGFDGDCLEMRRCETGVIMNFIGRVRRPSLIRVDTAGKRNGKRARSERRLRTSVQ
jgi:SAM-dependent methyltransferase